jgi:hypothetical protein
VIFENNFRLYEYFKLPVQRKRQMKVEFNQSFLQVKTANPDMKQTELFGKISELWKAQTAVRTGP